MMKTQAFVILISCFVCFKAIAIRVVSCDKQDTEYIATKHSSGALIQANEIEKVFPRDSLKHNEICEVRNEIIMDGLAFTLYKLQSEEQRYISVYNGLDGNFKLYGP
ncbi:hypothetical protein EU510_04195 [Pseudoalteromonas sp. FUC4]|uniref:hypothetical protein n=1 Tax=Pseudoalteromonas sp. FUC4 TaxID=2511201 RepID=UPI0011F22CF0|nr:hypothetical protein [Pseudoalteromonas sp. FUC4]KAA1155314.1 hypothetical protein EU510_04195 [Pseudoalteromonas sp. FUC4]